MQSDEVIPNISDFLVGAKTAVYEEEKRAGCFLVTFRVQYTRSYKIRAKTKGMATSIGRNRATRTLKNLSTKHKMRIEQVELLRTVNMTPVRKGNK